MREDHYDRIILIIAVKNCCFLKEMLSFALKDLLMCFTCLKAQTWCLTAAFSGAPGAGLSGFKF